ncbi:MAG: ATP-binding protein [Pyrinomonadaceae bacterium]
MPEDQNIEYKESWHDDYLKWICGFANSSGGTIFIGIDDDGNTVGVADSYHLMEAIPNKVRNQLGILVDVNRLEKDGLEVIEIVTSPYDVPISLRGRYYFRSGATKLELTGNALNEFLLRKAGRTWDDAVEPRGSLDDINEETVDRYKRDAAKSGRLPDDGEVSLREFLEKLRLIDNAQIKRAALVLFGKEPARFFPNQQVRIGRFGEADDDLKFQDVLDGNLLHLLYETADILNRKYFANPIDFEGLQRIEKGEYPVAAVREMLLNSLVHRSYMGAAVQIRMYDNKFSIWNEGALPAGLNLEALRRSHPSRPRNPLIADVCFKGGYIDAWGRGTLKIINACLEAELPEPEIVELDGGVQVTLFKNRYTKGNLKKLGLSERQIKAVLFALENGSITNSKYQEVADVSKATASRDIADLEIKGILINKGSKGQSAVYEVV